MKINVLILTDVHSSVLAAIKKNLGSRYNVITHLKPHQKIHYIIIDVNCLKDIITINREYRQTAGQLPPIVLLCLPASKDTRIASTLTLILQRNNHRFTHCYSEKNLLCALNHLDNCYPAPKLPKVMPELPNSLTMEMEFYRDTVLFVHLGEARIINTYSTTGKERKYKPFKSMKEAKERMEELGLGDQYVMLKNQMLVNTKLMAQYLRSLPQQSYSITHPIKGKSKCRNFKFRFQLQEEDYLHIIPYNTNEHGHAMFFKKIGWDSRRECFSC